MAEGTYEFECARAELLGIAAPNREEFEAAAAANQASNSGDRDALLEADVQQEQLKETSGKFDELNSILSVTQQRLSKFKSACGSLTNLLKLRPGETAANHEAAAGSSGGTAAATADASIGGALDTLDAIKTEEARSDVQVMRSQAQDMQQKMTCQFDALDSMLSKAENAEYSMNKQNRDMKRMLK